MMTAKRLVEASWAVSGVLFAKFFPLIGSILLIRIFGPESYGNYTLTVATINLLLTATGAGLVGGLVASIAVPSGSESAEARRHRVYAFKGVNLGLLLLVLICVGAAALAGVLDSQLAALISANWPPMLFLVVVQIQLASQAAVATVNGILKRLAVTSLAGGMLTTLIQLAGGYQWGVTGALWGMAMGYVLQVVLQARYLHSVQESAVQPPLRRPASFVGLAILAWKDFVRYGGYMFGSSVVVSIGMWLLSFVLLREGTGMVLVAAFGVMNHWRMLILFLPLALSNYLITRFAVLSDPSQRLRILGISLVATLPLMALTIGTFSMAAQILTYIYGSGYAAMTVELKLTAIIALLAGVNSIFGNFLIGSSMFKEGLISNLVWFLALLGALGVLQGDGFDVMDAMLCLLSAYVFHTVYQLFVLLRWLRGAIPAGRTTGV